MKINHVGEGITLPTSVGSLKKQESFRKTATFPLLTTPKPLTGWITRNRGKFFKRREYQTTLPASWEICMQVRKQQLELDMEQQTGSKSGKEHVKPVYSHPAHLTHTQSASWETRAGGSTEESSLCCAASSHHLPVLCRVVHIGQSQFIHFPFPLLVTIHLFSMSISLFLLCK